MIYYNRLEEYEFFEHKRFDNENRPTWKEISFISYNKYLKELYSMAKNKEEKVPENLWKKLSKIFMYENNEDIENLRDAAFQNEPLIKEYFEEGKIKGFENFIYNEKTVLERLKDINIESYSNMYEYFQRGEHIGNCGITSRLMGIMFEKPLFHIGKADFLQGTKNYVNHAWIETKMDGKQYIVDTSMMLIIPMELKEKIGYITTKKPHLPEVYIREDEDLYYNHYKCVSQYSTKNKFSYVGYIEKLKELEKNKEIEER